MSFACIHSFDAPGLGQARDGGDRGICAIEVYSLQGGQRKIALSPGGINQLLEHREGRLRARVVERVRSENGCHEFQRVNKGLPCKLGRQRS